MSSAGYRPIRVGEPGERDILLGVERRKFEVVPQLSYLDIERGSTRVQAMYLDPVRGSIGVGGKVVYHRSRSLTRLSEEPLFLRHNGETADMEVYIDQYNLTTLQPYVGEYGEVLPEILEGERYDRMTWGYIYAGVEVISKSNVIWDGRPALCIQVLDQVEIEGEMLTYIEEVENRNYVEEVREQVRRQLESKELQPTEVVPMGGLGYTRRSIAEDIHVDKYQRVMENFLKDNYSGRGIERVAVSTRGIEKLKVGIEVYRGYDDTVTIPYEGYRDLPGKIAAVLDGPLFVKWVKLLP